MTTEEIREQVVRMEGFADGVKFGANGLAKWLVDAVAREEAARVPSSQGSTPPPAPTGD